MIYCPNCTAVNNPGARFCLNCGKPLAGGGMQTIALGGMVQGRYQVQRLLGQGGMGAVYQVLDTRLGGKLLAMKEMSDAALTDPAEKAAAIVAFRHEAELLANLDHTNIPKISDYFYDGGKYYIVMELVQGETLKARLARQGAPCSETDVRTWAMQLAQVLEYLHSRTPPVIFRDFKPGNIMITPSGQVKLIDFGIARLFKPGKVSDTQAMGTTGYAPPEQYGKGQTDVRSDIYSLGVVLHEALTCHDPVTTPFNLPAVRQLNPSVSQDLENIVARATKTDRVLRYQNITEMMHGLGRNNYAIVAMSPMAPKASRRKGIAHKATVIEPNLTSPLTLRLPRRIDKLVTAALKERNDPIIHEIVNTVARRDLPTEGVTFMLRGVAGSGGTELAIAMRNELLSFRKGFVLVATVPLSTPAALPEAAKILDEVVASLKEDRRHVRWRLRRSINETHALIRRTRHGQGIESIEREKTTSIGSSGFSLEVPKAAIGINLALPFSRSSREKVVVNPPALTEKDREAVVVDKLRDLVSLLVSNSVRVVLIFDGLKEIDALRPLAPLVVRPGVYTVIIADAADHDRWQSNSPEYLACFSKVSKYVECQWRMADEICDQVYTPSQSEQDHRRKVLMRQHTRYCVRGVPKRVLLTEHAAFAGIHDTGGKPSLWRSLSRYRHGQLHISEEKWPAIMCNARMQNALDVAFERLFGVQGAPALHDFEARDKAYLALYEFSDWLIERSGEGAKVSKQTLLDHGLNDCEFPFDQITSRRLLEGFLGVLIEQKLVTTTQRGVILSGITGTLREDTL